MTDRPFEHGPAYHVGRDALTEKEIDMVITALGSIAETTLLEFAISTGMRRDDIVNTRIADIQEISEAGQPGPPAIYVTYWEKKRRRYWHAHVSGPTAQHVLMLVNLYKQQRLRTPWLFPSPRDPQHHLSSRQAYNVFQKALKVAGLRSRPFHALRATCMKQCKRMGWTIEQTMELTGDSFRTVQEHYLTPSIDEMKEVAVKAPPVRFGAFDRLRGLKPLVPEKETK